MKDKTLTIFIILLALILGGFFAYDLFLKDNASPGVNLPAGEEPLAEEETDFGQNTEKPILTSTVIQREGFEMVLAPGWLETTEIPDVLFAAVDAGEDYAGESLADLGFRTNFSLKSDDLNKYVSITRLVNYSQSIKESLIQIIPSIQFNREEAKTVGGNEAVFIECESLQEDLEFSTLLAFIKTSDNIVYVFSFNTLQEFWPDYKDVFYQMAESFQITN